MGLNRGVRLTEAERLRIIGRAANRLADTLHRIVDGELDLRHSDVQELVGVVESIRDFANGYSPLQLVPEPQSLRVPPARVPLRLVK